NTTSIAIATQPPGSSPRKVASPCSGSDGCTTVAVVWASDMQFRLYRFSGMRQIDLEAGQPVDHLLRRLRGNGLDLGPRGLERLANFRFRRFELGVDLLRGSMDLGFGRLGARLLGVVGELGGVGPRRVHPRAPRGFGLIGGDTRRLR